MLSSIYSMKRRNDEGFTLLELLIVVIIIGILAAIALPIFLNQQKAAVDASVKSDVHNTALQVQSWQVDHKGATAADATEYINAGGKVTLTSNGNYVGLVVKSDGTYDVCGYNAKGLNLTGPTAAFVYDGTTGHFDQGTGCFSAVAQDPTSDSGSGSGSTGASSNPTYTADPAAGAAGATDPSITGVPAGGSNPAGGGSSNPGSGTGGNTTTDPGPTGGNQFGYTTAYLYPSGDGNVGTLGNYHGPRFGFQYTTGTLQTYATLPYYVGGVVVNESVPASGTYNSPDLNSLDGLTATSATSTQTISGANYDVYTGDVNPVTGKVSNLVNVNPVSKGDCTFSYGVSNGSVQASLACPFTPDMSEPFFANQANGTNNGVNIYSLVVKFKAKDVNGNVQDNTLQLTPQNYDS